MCGCANPAPLRRLVTPCAVYIMATGQVLQERAIGKGRREANRMSVIIVVLCIDTGKLEGRGVAQLDRASQTCGNVLQECRFGLKLYE